MLKRHAKSRHLCLFPYIWENTFTIKYDVSFRFCFLFMYYKFFGILLNPAVAWNVVIENILHVHKKNTHVYFYVLHFLVLTLSHLSICKGIILMS